MFRLYICSHHEAGYKTLNKIVFVVFLFKIQYRYIRTAETCRCFHMYDKSCVLTNPHFLYMQTFVHNFMTPATMMAMLMCRKYE
jgi:hypothetical protein